MCENSNTTNSTELTTTTTTFKGNGITNKINKIQILVQILSIYIILIYS